MKNITIAAFLSVVFTASVGYSNQMLIEGANVTILSGANRSVADTTVGGTVIGGTQIGSGALGRFDPTLGVLTNAVATATVLPEIGFIKGGGGGSAYAYSAWSLGGNSSGNTTINAAVNNTYDFDWDPITLTSTAANLNNFVGAGNVTTNSFSSYLTVNKSGGTTSAYAHSGTSLTQKLDLVVDESIAYTYSTHSNASFALGSDVNNLTIDLGQIAFGTSHDQGFSIFNLGGLGLTGFTLSLLSGDNLFSVTGGNIAAGGTGLYNAHFAGQAPVSSTTYDGIYRLGFSDNVSGLTQYASNSIGTNYIDLRMMASVGPTTVPESGSVASLLGLGMFGLLIAARRLKTAG